MRPEYIVAGISILNDIEYADGNKAYGRLGGSGLFACGGIGFFTGSFTFLTSAGDDYFRYYGTYFEENGIDKSAVCLTMPKTHHTLLKYEKDGTWNEKSVYGEDYFSLQEENCRTSFQKLRPFLHPETKGLYIDSGAHEKIFEEIAEIRRLSPHITIMWEPPTFSSKDPSLSQRVLDDIRKVDFYSMNLDEAAAFFRTEGKENIIKKIIELGVPSFLRMGEEGSAWIEEGKVYSLHACDPSSAIDVTGCGNTSAAAALYARNEASSLSDIPLYANIAAGYCSRFKGPAPFKKARDTHAFEKMKEYYL